ncbi:unnamed protein product, partial [Mesorhabditis spiculigera]
MENWPRFAHLKMDEKEPKKMKKPEEKVDLQLGEEIENMRMESSTTKAAPLVILRKQIVHGAVNDGKITTENTEVRKLVHGEVAKGRIRLEPETRRRKPISKPATARPTAEEIEEFAERRKNRRKHMSTTTMIMPVEEEMIGSEEDAAMEEDSEEVESRRLGAKISSMMGHNGESVVVVRREESTTSTSTTSTTTTSAPTTTEEMMMEKQMESMELEVMGKTPVDIDVKSVHRLDINNNEAKKVLVVEEKSPESVTIKELERRIEQELDRSVPFLEEDTADVEENKLVLNHFSIPIVENGKAAFLLTNGAALADYRWIGLYNQCTKEPVPLISLDGLDPPREEIVAPIQGKNKRITSGPVRILNCNTILVPDFVFQEKSEKPASFFFVGIGTFPNKIEGQRRARVLGFEGDEPLENYHGDDVMIRLPNGLRTFDVDFLAIYNEVKDEYMAFVTLPSVLVPPCAEETTQKP